MGSVEGKECSVLATTDEVVFSLIGILFIAVIGVYMLVIKMQKDVGEALGKIYQVVNDHHQNASIHQDGHEFVSRDVCNVRVHQMMETLQEIKRDVKFLREGKKE